MLNIEQKCIQTSICLPFLCICFPRESYIYTVLNIVNYTPELMPSHDNSLKITSDKNAQNESLTFIEK